MIIKPRMLLLAALLLPAAALSQGTSPSYGANRSSIALAPQAVQVPDGCALVRERIGPRPTSVPAAHSLLPTQLEVRTPFEPTAFPSGAHSYLIYELHFRNFEGEPLDLQGLEVMGESAVASPVATFGADELPALLFPRAHGMSAEAANESRQLVKGQGVVAYLCLAFEPGTAVPAQLRHRIFLKDGYADGPAIGTRHSRLRTLAPPVAGSDWIAAGGPGNTSHHRVGLLIIGGNARISRRYAIDWKQVREGVRLAGDASDARSYHAYGEQVFAVADGIVVSAKDGFPDNVPRTSKGFETALPLTMDNIAGNAVTLDLGDGQFALYAHLQPGSVRVKKGDRVKQGQVLGRIGNSGDSREPHLHFEVTDSPELLAGEGLPYLIDRYEIKSQDGSMDSRANELPTLEMLTNFRPAEEIAN